MLTGNTARFNTETESNLLVLEAGVAGVLVLVLLGGRLLWLSVKRIRRFADVGLRLQLAAVAAPLAALFVLCFAGPVTVTAPSAPYLWLAAGVLSYWLPGSGNHNGAAQRDPTERA